MIDGLTGEQRFFMGWAQVWRADVAPRGVRAPARHRSAQPVDLRCNVARNLHEFHDAFGVTEGDGMWLDPADRVLIF